MSNLKLAVEVVSAHNLMPRHGQGTTSAYVEFLFDGQRARTSTKERDVNPVWNETIFFDVSDPNRLPDLVVEANVFHNGNANSTTFLGKVCLPGTLFVPCSDAVDSRHPLKKRGIFCFSRVKRELVLKAFHTGNHYLANPNQSQPSVNHEAQSESHEPPKVMRLPRPSDYLPKETSPCLGGGHVVRGRFVRGDSPVISTHELVETMHYLFVRVVKALDLSCRDTYVEVKVGKYKEITRNLERKQNPEWNEVFAFPKENLQSSELDVVVKDKELVDGDFVGSVRFALNEVPTRVPPDSPVPPERHQVVDKDGKKKGELMLAVWYGTQADEAFPNAWYSDVILPADTSSAAYTHVRSKVYPSPRLWYVRVNVIEARDLVVPDTSRIPVAYASIQIGHQCLKTKEVQSLNPMWNEELMFVTAEPFDDQHLIVSVEDHVCPEETLGRVSIALNSVERCGESADDDQIICGQWFNLDMSLSNVMERDIDHKFSRRIHLHVCLDGGYHLLDDSSNYCNDLQQPVGVLKLGVLNAKDLMPMKTETGKATTDSYCVAKYGDKWVRTRTITNSTSPKYNEPYTWEVYDPVSFLTVGVFNNGQIGNSSGKTDKEIGKVRIRISTLESDHLYTHSYPLLSVSSSGLKKTGELHLAIRYSCISFVNLMLIYSHPISVKIQKYSFYLDQAVLVVADRLAQVEPPLGKEVVEYMYSDAADVHAWSLRRSKANFFRMMSVLSPFISVLKWFEEVRAWRSPIITVLVHVLFVMLVCTPKLTLSTVFLYTIVIGIWNFRDRQRHPPHVDTRLSHADSTHPDELDEEFDTFPTSQKNDIIRMRYDRLRSIAGRIQTVVGDVAIIGEKIQELRSWRDPRATFIFITFCLFVAIVLFVTPLKAVVIVAGFYLMRHPRFRRRQQMPSVLANFYRRLPTKADCIL
ncbi:hypothetical protein D8674_039648 [Pyrus ussuriensis x Pyrus communis]|uniref:C2 domain-containing protein n=1 Tax=Pyrus ussuriensis x Pyrus communis TaxID=2448454 RepID=A0A5N5H2B2_9ROSA|nr:hypothetical protein D8674_039648 [Pyrus ussuriensis x Pyrus communis]